MSTKKVSYMDLLKEAIQGHDPVAANVSDVKGPMLDPILKYSGEGELETHKDASSILERYYFGEDQDKGISILDEDGPIDNEINEVPDKNLAKTKKDIEKEVTEQDNKEEEEEEEEVTEQDEKVKDEEEEEEEVTESDKLENAIIEKLIEEMEEEVNENRTSGDRGAGTKAAGTEDGDPEKIVKGRKDSTNENKKVAKEEDEEEELDLDKELGDEEVEEATTAGAPVPKMDVDKEDHGDEIEEAFEIFKEAIEDDEIEDIKSDEIRV